MAGLDGGSDGAGFDQYKTLSIDQSCVHLRASKKCFGKCHRIDRIVKCRKRGKRKIIKQGKQLHYRITFYFFFYFIACPCT